MLRLHVLTVDDGGHVAQDDKFAGAKCIADEKIASAAFTFSDLASAGRCPKAASLLFGTAVDENKRLRRLANSADWSRTSRVRRRVLEVPLGHHAEGLDSL